MAPSRFFRFLTGGILASALSVSLVPAQLSAAPTPTNRDTSAQTDAALRALALAVAHTLPDPAMRAVINTQANLQFDGDTEFLYGTAADLPVAKGQTVRERLAANYGLSQQKMGRALAPEQAQRELDALVGSVPNLQIAVRGDFKAWDVATYVPLVSYASSTLEAQKQPRLEAFDAQGNITWLDSAVEPTVPVLVVGINERVDATGQRLPAVSMTPSAAPAVTHGATDAYVCRTRTEGAQEYLQRFQIPDLGAIEPWALGAPELRLNLKSAAGDILEYRFEPGRRRDVNDGRWYTLNAPLFMWYADTHGGLVAYSWVEEDSGHIITITFSVGAKVKLAKTGEFNATLGGTLPIKNDDDQMGHAGVGCRDDLGTMYTTGMINWYAGSAGGQWTQTDFTLPSFVGPNTPVILNASASYAENWYFLEVYRTSAVGAVDVTGPYWSQAFPDDRAEGDIDLANYYAFPVVGGQPTVYRVKVATSNQLGGWVERVKYVTVLP